MLDSVDSTAFNFEQGQRARKLFAAVVLAALDDAIADDKKYGNGPDQIARWARSRDGREVLSCAGIDPNERVVKGLMEFVGKGVRTSVALSREDRHLFDRRIEPGAPFLDMALKVCFDGERQGPFFAKRRIGGRWDEVAVEITKLAASRDPYISRSQPLA